MNKEELTMISFEIVSYSGDARSKLLLALEKAKQQKFDECDKLVKDAEAALVDAHNVQMDVMQQEALGRYGIYHGACTRQADDDTFIQRYYWNSH